jgi:L-iditol 2-dehydrogenase
MLEPLGVAIHAVDLAKPRLLENVVLLGAGPIGLLVMQVLRAAGAGEIFVVEPLAHRRVMAMRLGAAGVGESVAEVPGWTDGKGFSLVVEATNNPRGFRDAVLAARIGGRVILVGIPDGDTYTLPAAEARRRALKIKFVRRMGEVYPRAIGLVASGRVDVSTLVTHRVDLATTPDVFRALADNEPGYVKALVYPNGL